METYIFLGIVGLFRLVTGVALLRLAAQQKLPNLNWLALGFIITVIDIPFTAQPYIPYVDKTLSYFAYLCFALFIARTFDQDKRSPFVPFWTVFTLLYAVMYGMTGRFMFDATGIGFPQNIFAARPAYETVPMTMSETIDTVIYGFLQIAIWLWHAVAGFQTSKAISGDAHVEDWIKSRYTMIVTYSALQSLVGVVMIMRPFASSTITIIIASALLVVVTTVMQYFVWVMPAGFRQWLNRNQGAREKEQIHEKASLILNILGTAMSDGTGLSKMLAIYSLRQIIGTKINTKNTEQIELHAASMPYIQWLAILKDPDLYILLKNSGPNIDARQILKKAENALIEKQSLFTMQAK